MLRAGALSLIVLFGIALVLPLPRSTARTNHAAASHRGHKHSRAWWRRYRARLRHRRAAAAAMLKQNVAPSASVTPVGDQWSPSPVASFAHSGGAYNDPRGLFNLKMPEGWTSQVVAPNGDTKFRVFANNQQIGQAMFSLVPANAAGSVNRIEGGAAMGRRGTRPLGGIAVAELRRRVIDKMITAGGWVVNDFEREIGGRRSFIVLAQTPASTDGRTPEQSWAFYYTEVDNRVYGLAMSALPQFSKQLTANAEQLLTSFHAAGGSTLAVSPGH
ncbi:MAG: hypothetical protein ABR577_17050 [Pyrinomonadaceae bacterium]